MKAGFGKREITPEVPGDSGPDIRILGFWYERAKRYHRIADPLHVRAAAFSANGEVVCVVSMDLIGDAIGIGATGRQRIQESLGIPPDHVMVACTHSHTTPETLAISGHPVPSAWRHRVVRAIEAAARDAVDSLEPCEVGLAEQEITGLNVNRRASWLAESPGFADLSDLRRARATATDGVLRVAWSQREGAIPGLLANFACHPVALQTQPMISADYPGLAMAAVEEHVGVGLFTNGATGDLNPSLADGMADAKATGQKLAAGVLDTLHSRPDTTIEAGARIRCATRRVMVPRRTLPPVQELEAKRRQLQAEVVAAGGMGVNDPEHRGRRLYEVNEVLALHDFPLDLRAEIQAIEIGEWLLVGVPGELFCCLGEDIRQAARAHKVWVVGYANGYLGYIAPRDAFDMGGYEVRLARWSPMAPGAGETIRDHAIALVREMEGRS